MKIKKFFLTLASLYFFNSFSILIHAHALVFVHLGNSLPPHLEDAVWQASLFNNRDEIYVIANQKALEQPHALSALAGHLIPAESLQTSQQHAFFRQNSVFDRHSLWFLACERFFYLDELMKQYDIKDLFHLENDNLLFVNLKELLPVLHERYPNIAAVFDNDNRCIPGFFYIAHKEAATHLTCFFAEQARFWIYDMETIGNYKKNYNTLIENLPIIPPTYTKFYPLITSYQNMTTQTPAAYSLNSELFHAIFDGAALGQYLGGLDPYHNHPQQGFVNERCLFSPAHLNYEFESDELGRQIPYAVFKGERYRINNLHMHSKNLKPFLSKPRIS